MTKEEREHLVGDLSDIERMIGEALKDLNEIKARIADMRRELMRKRT